jgi:hypothetical protein
MTVESLAPRAGTPSLTNSADEDSRAISRRANAKGRQRSVDWTSGLGLAFFERSDVNDLSA